MRYVLTNDDDGHWYIIPADKREEFNEWVYGGWEDGVPQPKWAGQIGGHPHNVTFTSPEIFGEPHV